MDEQQRFDELERLFAAVEGVAPGDRAARLAELGASAEIAEEVLGLFAFDRETAFDGVRGAVGRVIGSDEDGGAVGKPRIPGVRVGEVLGAGAMGVVYRGEQEDPPRPVAVKVLRSGPRSAALVRRFRSEAEALARLRHPGIAAVHAAGIAEGAGVAQPYLVMELVEGEPLDRWLEARCPGVRERIELMERVCAAVQHAHGRGVIHRDLKPSNILVTAEGEPKIVDFGVARVEDPSRAVSMATAAGDLVGTLAFMSPEQLSGDPGAVDARSDVYALGVVLFLVLSGRLPHDMTTLSIAAAAREIEERAATRLSAVRPEMRGDLEIIVGHALEKEKERRYQTAEALREDLRRFREGLPINARAASAVYVLGRMARRNKAAVGAAALLAAALVTTTVLSVRSATLARRAEEEGARSAERVKEMNEFVIVDMLLSARGSNAGPNVRVIDTVDAALPRIAERFADDPLGEAKVRQMMAVLLGETGRHREAEEQLRTALARMESAGLGGRREVLDMRHTLANQLVSLGKPDQAELEARGLLEELGRRGLPAEDGMWEAAESVLAAALQSQGKVEEAAAVMERLIAGVRARGTPYPRRLLAMYSTLLMAGRQLRWSPERIDGIYSEMLSLAEGFDDPAARVSLFHYQAARQTLRGEYAEALETRKRQLELARATLDPRSLDYIWTVTNTANSYGYAGDEEMAKELFAEGVDLYAATLGPRHYEVERNSGVVATLCERLGEVEEARRWRLREVTTRFFVAGPDEMPSLLDRVGKGAEVMGSEEAFLAHLIAVGEGTPAWDPATPDGPTPAYWANVGRVLAERDDPRCEALLVRAAESIERGDPEDRPADVVERVAAALPAFLERGGRGDEAAEWRRRLATLAERAAAAGGGGP